jgi:hypothetical protein
MVCEWFGLKTTRTVSSGLASKPAETVFAGLASKPVTTVFSSLSSKLVVTTSPGLASKPTCDIPPLSRDGHSQPGSIRGANNEALTHNTHIHGPNIELLHEFLSYKQDT